MLLRYRLQVPTLFVIAFITIPTHSQQKGLTNTADGLIMLSVTVRNGDGQNLNGLSREAFELVDEKKTRTIEFFENTDTPLSIGILIDTSESMRLFETRETSRAKLGEAILHLLQLGNPNNEYFLASFDKVPRFLTDWKNSTELLAQKTDIIEANRDTALYDACLAALEKLTTAHHARRVLILISDGEDNVSHQTFVSLRQRLRDSDISLYAVGPVKPNDIGSSLGLEGAGILTELVETTGGEAFFPKNKKQLDAVMEQIALELRHKYRLGFRSDKAEATNKWHRLKVKIKLPPNLPAEFSKVIVRTRQGYYTH